jgi:tRNA pseudouridine55 synthase
MHNRRKDQRPDALKRLAGIFAVNKPAGCTSFDVVARVRKLLHSHFFPPRPNVQPPSQLAIKVGHGGTLDPFATGLLVIGVGDGCKQMKTYLSGSKEYVATAMLGIETDTLDITGKQTKQLSYEHVTQQKLEQALTQFHGDIMQRPPMYSAVHHQGERLYILARKNKLEGVEVAPRKITIYRLKLIEFAPPLFTIEVQSLGGMYVRKLVQDIAEAVGSCAHVTALQRTGQGPFTTASALNENEWTALNFLEAMKKKH